MAATKNEPLLRLLLSFSPEDRELTEQLVLHLQVLVRFAGLDIWTVDRVQAGDTWRQEVDAALSRADVALLLISADFLAADFVQDVEVPKLFQRHEQEGLKIIPVLLRSCLWQAHPWLRTLRPIPHPRQAIASMPEDIRDRVLTEVAAEIRQLISARLRRGSTQDANPFNGNTEITAALIVNAVNGNTRDGRILRDYVYGWVKPIAGKRHTEDAEDITNEVLAQLVTSVREGAFSNVAPHASRLVAILAVRRTMDILRRKGSFESMNIDEFPATENLTPEARLDIRRWLNELPAHSRTLLLMYESGFDVSEIAESLGVSAESISTRLYRLKKFLRFEYWNRVSKNA